MTDQTRAETGWTLFLVGLAISVPGTFLLTEPLGLELWKHFAVSIAAPAGFFLLLLAAKYV
ncbi:MAG TPA: hypothetical protein PLH23_05930 [Hyphomonadaceae bacterium]|nr:hypothetical protein [Hyphomonadaceae bacterium]HPI47789.1 hypothetical protein [Hyphomonadaceae bacterium]